MKRSISGNRNMRDFSQYRVNSRLRVFVDCFEKWKDEADQSYLPPFIQTLISTPVRDLHSVSCPLRVSLISPISEVMETLQNVRTIIVQRDTEPTGSDALTPLLFSRIVFFEHAITSANLSDPLSTLVDRIPPLDCVHVSETLDTAIQKMLCSGFEEVGVMDAGMITGVLHVDDIFAFLSKEYIKSDFTSAKSAGTFKPTADLDESSLQVQTSADITRQIESQRRIQSMSPIQRSAQVFCKGYWTEILLVGCILLDISCSIFVYENDSTGSGDIAEQKMEVATGIILFIFAYEAFVRIYGFRFALLRLPFEIIDLSIVAVSVIVYSLMLDNLLGSDSKSVVTLARIIRGLRMFKVVKLLFETIMKQRMMYNRDGFALDLSFITNNCIAMSTPAVGSQANFSNPIEEVYRFFNTKYLDRYLIFNLSAKQTYSDDYFEGRVERIQVEKHYPPRMNQVVAFVESAGNFLNEDTKACVAVHCKDGRGRTGVMIAAWLLYSRFAESADDAMSWFITHRVSKKASISDGILMPSQQRYVRYMQQALKDSGFYTKRLLLQKITIKTCPRMDSDHGCNLWFSIEVEGRVVHCSIENGQLGNLKRIRRDQKNEALFVDVFLAGDVRLTLYNRDLTSLRDELCCFVCFHTGFVQSTQLEFSKDSIDVASTDRKCKVFAKDFSMVLDFDQLPSVEDNPRTISAPKGTFLGPFRKLLRPSQKIIDMALWMRGRDMKVQIKSAMKLSRRIFGDNFQRKSVVNEVNESNEGDSDNLCCATGPVVRHESVELYKHEDAAIRLHNVSSPAFSAGKYISQTFGAKIARSWVSGNKRRFVEDGFDLDLSYISPRVIAMGFPSSGIESSYRNSMEEVYRFFQARHAAHYRVVNLCSEREYHLDAFHGNCVRYPFDDHNPPALELLLPCCANIHKFLQADPDNVVAIHCKAGKGRTGLIVVAYLMYCGLKANAVEARTYYDHARTYDGKGVTIISQQRYAHYFEQLLRVLKEGKEPLETEQDKSPALLIHRIRLHTIPRLNFDASGSASISLCVKSEQDHKDYEIFTTQTINGLHEDFDAKTTLNDKIDIDIGARVAGDFRTTFCDDTKSKVIFFFVLHTSLVLCPPSQMGGKLRDLTSQECTTEGLPPSTRSLVLMKQDIDRAAKDTRCAHFDHDFRVEIFFGTLEGESGTGKTLEVARDLALSKQAPSAEARERPLKTDRDAYQAFVKSVAETGQSPPSFVDWLLTSVYELESMVPVAASRGQADCGSASCRSSGAMTPLRASWSVNSQHKAAGSGDPGTEWRLDVKDGAAPRGSAQEAISAALGFPERQ